MKRLIMFVLFLSLGLMLTIGGSGCTFAGGDLNKDNTQVQLRENNFKVIKTVRGEDSGFRFCGIGSAAMYAEAMDKLRSDAALSQGSRALVNMTEDRRSKFWFGPAVVTESLVISADVVEFKNDPPGAVASATNK